MLEEQVNWVSFQKFDCYHHYLTKNVPTLPWQPPTPRNGTTLPASEVEKLGHRPLPLKRLVFSEANPSRLTINLRGPKESLCQTSRRTTAFSLCTSVVSCAIGWDLISFSMFQPVGRGPTGANFIVTTSPGLGIVIVKAYKSCKFIEMVT